MSENKLNRFVWSEVAGLLDNREKIKEENIVQKKNDRHEEIEYLKKQIETTKNGRDRLLTLLTISEDEDGIDLEEIKEKMKESHRKENALKEKLEALQHKADEERSKKSAYPLEEVMKHYLNIKNSNLDTKRKQKILKMIIQEVEVIDSNTIHIQTF